MFPMELLWQKRHFAVGGFLAFLKGLYYKAKFRLLMRHVRIGRWLRVYGTLHIVGPGSVEIGDNVILQCRYIKPISISTQKPSAMVRIGNNVGLNGTTVQCFESIVIEDDCAIAALYITDSQNHALTANRRQLSLESVVTGPVHVGKNVWISVGVIVLHGVTIGENSVIGAASLVCEDVPPNVLAAGNPLRIIKPIPQTNEDTSAPTSRLPLSHPEHRDST